MDIRKTNAMTPLPVHFIPQVWKYLKDRNSKGLPVFDHFSKYLFRGYTNSKWEQVQSKWRSEMWSIYCKVLWSKTRITDKL
jgi:hypothetical protein